MSEEQIKEVFGLGDDSKPEEVVSTPEDKQVDDVPQLSATEQKAYDQGWRPQEDFEGPEDHWKTAKEYVKDGEWLNKIKDLNHKLDDQKRDFDERLENTNKLNEARRQSEIEDLKKKQRDAVDLADTDSFDAAQVKIDKLEKEAVDSTPTQPGKDPAITAWETSNPWINDLSDERTDVAQGIYNSFAQKNPTATPSQALAHVDQRLSKLFPPNNTNPRREQPSSNETPKRAANRGNKDLSMSDLTQAEQGEWNTYGAMMFKTEKAFLKAVSDARKK